MIEVLFATSSNNLVVRTHSPIRGSLTLHTQTKEIQLGLLDKLSAFVELYLHGDTLAIEVLYNKALTQETITLPSVHNYLTESAWLSFFETTNGETGDILGEISNFVLDYNVNSFSYKQTDIYRNAMVNGCVGATSTGKDVCSKDNLTIKAYNDIVPFLFSSLDSEETIHRLTNQSTSELTYSKLYLRFWLKQSNIHLEIPSRIALIGINGSNPLELKYHDNQFLIFVNGTQVWASPETDEVLTQWIHFKATINFTTSTLQLSFTKTNSFNLFNDIANQYIASLVNPGVLTQGNSASVQIGEQTEENPNTFNIYNFVFGLGDDVNYSPQKPISLPKSCLTGPLGAPCFNHISPEIDFDLTGNISSQGYVYRPLGLLEGLNGGYIWAPSFGISIEVKNINFSSLPSNLEPLFVIAGGHDLKDIQTTINPKSVDLYKSNFALVIEDKKYIKLINYVNGQASVITFNSVEAMPLITSFFLNIIYDDVQQLLVMTFQAMDLTTVTSSRTLKLEPITASSMIYKRESIGKVWMDLDGVESEAIDKESIMTASVFCNRQESHATECEFYKEISAMIYTECESGYVTNLGACEKRNTFPSL